jgi:predicted nucleic acid-binding protein
VNIVLDSSIMVAWLYREQAATSVDEIFENLVRATA